LDINYVLINFFDSYFKGGVMEIAVAIFSWLLTILGAILILSAPIELLIKKTRLDWNKSNEQKIYKRVQGALLGVVILILLVTVVLMTV